MVKKLKVSIGGHRDAMQVAWVNDSSQPTEIDTDLFVGRVSVFVRDFSGVTPDGSAPRKDHPYFHGRSRAFGILIEGRFKNADGTTKDVYNGDEIQFGTDFDYLPASFPRTPFNIGMNIAQRVDPATHYEEHPASDRPFIMSPYVACMNTFCAYPAPEAISRALVLAHHDSAHPHHPGEIANGSSEGFVPLETIERDEGKTVDRAEVNYWRFVGLRGAPAVDSFLESHKHLLQAPEQEPAQTATAATSNGGSNVARPGMRPRASTHLDLGTSTKRSNSLESESSTNSTSKKDFGQYDEASALSAVLGAPIHSEPASTSSGTSTPKGKKKSKFSLSGLMGALPGSSGSHDSRAVDEQLHAGDLTTADRIVGGTLSSSNKADTSPVETQLGPWRFADPHVDAVEDSTFIFLDPSHTRTVAQRRKHFVTNSGENRKSFKYDPAIVYTASFYTPFADLNTFTVNMGPVHINIAKFFVDMPIRYTLRSTRLVPRRDGRPGEEEETFATIAFQLVDE